MTHTYGGTEARRFARGWETLPRDERLGWFADGEGTEPHDERLASDGRMYQLIRRTTGFASTLEITFLESDAEAYSFTFG